MSGGASNRKACLRDAVTDALVAVQLPRILRLPFAMSFWALSFPVAGLTIASFLYAEKTGSAAHLAIGRGQICVPE